MYVWDKNVEYQSNEPYLLTGGYENFAMHYPMMVVNPEKSRIPKTDARNGNLVGQIEYPDLDNGFIATPSPKPHQQQPQNPADSDEGSNAGTDDGPTSPAIKSGAIRVKDVPLYPVAAPLIPDRKSKPAMPASNNNSELNNAKMYGDDSTPSELGDTADSDSAISQTRFSPAHSGRTAPKVDRYGRKR